MTTTKAKPVASGSYTNVTLDAASLVSNADPTISALPAGQLLQAMQAANEWHNVAGLGTAATRAQSTANAAGILLEDV